MPRADARQRDARGEAVIAARSLPLTALVTTGASVSERDGRRVRMVEHGAQRRRPRGCRSTRPARGTRMRVSATRPRPHGRVQGWATVVRGGWRDADGRSGPSVPVPVPANAWGLRRNGNASALRPHRRPGGSRTRTPARRAPRGPACWEGPGADADEIDPGTETCDLAVSPMIDPVRRQAPRLSSSGRGAPALAVRRCRGRTRASATRPRPHGRDRRRSGRGTAWTPGRRRATLPCLR